MLFDITRLDKSSCSGCMCKDRKKDAALSAL